MNVKDLANVSDESRRLINEHLKSENKTVNALSVESGVHATQLWLFLKGDRGLTDSSLQKIGSAILKSETIKK